MNNTDKARTVKRKEKVDYILTNGNDATCTRYTTDDLAYRTDLDLTFIMVKIKANIINNKS